MEQNLISKFSLRSLNILKNLKCYENIYDLTVDQITEKEKMEYISSWNNMKDKIEEWFFNKYCDDKACYINVGEDEVLFFFEVSEIGEKSYFTLSDFLEEKNIKTKEEFYKEVKKLEIQLSDKELTEKEIKLLENINCYDSKYELAINESSEDDFYWYMDSKSNLKELYEDYFCNDYYRLIHVLNLGLGRFLYFFIEEYTFEYDRSKYIDLINKIINSKDIEWNANEFNEFKKIYKGEKKWNLQKICCTH